jgi:hypothetical protein
MATRDDIESVVAAGIIAARLPDYDQWCIEHPECKRRMIDSAVAEAERRGMMDAVDKLFQNKKAFLTLRDGKLSVNNVPRGVEIIIHNYDADIANLEDLSCVQEDDHGVAFFVRRE